MRMYLKPVLSGLLLMFAMSAMAQRTNEYLQPCYYLLRIDKKPANWVTDF